MREVAIVGAGELGGLAAHALARRNLAAAIRLIDANGRVAEGKALDISQAAPIEGFASVVTGSADLSTAAGAEIVVIADRAGGPGEAPGGVWDGEDGLTLLRQLNAIAPRALFLCSGASHRELVERSARELHIARTRILGCAAEAFVATAAAMVALELDVSARDVSLSVFGVPPDHIVIAWEAGAVAGLALTAMMNEPTRRRLTGRISAMWPPGPYALASALCKVVDAAFGNTRRPLTCFAAPDDRSGVRARTAALPVRFNAAGVVEVTTPMLSAVERVALDNAMMV